MPACDPQSLATASACDDGQIPAGFASAVLIALYCNIANSPVIACDSQTLVNQANCYHMQIPDGMKTAVMIYLLNQISGLNLTPQQLAAAAVPIDKQIPDGMKMAVLIDVTCAAAQVI